MERWLERKVPEEIKLLKKNGFALVSTNGTLILLLGLCCWISSRSEPKTKLFEGPLSTPTPAADLFKKANQPETLSWEANYLRPPKWIKNTH
ncbi:MAG: hypothetical protein V1808_00175 [Candidatus Daviesbacteria bacterium]